MNAINWLVGIKTISALWAEIGNQRLKFAVSENVFLTGHILCEALASFISLLLSTILYQCELL